MKRVHRNIGVVFHYFALACEFGFKVSKKVVIGPKSFLL
jgi:hypothetical protein